MPDKPYTLENRYTLTEGKVALTGIQALVRLPIVQNRRDREAGLKVGTYVSGYQGSPLGELDKQMTMALPLLRQHDIVFQAGLNEDVAATAIYGSQMLEFFPHESFDGVVGIWYGKAPGVDRTGDAFRHGQYIGTGKYGGALALVGDDPSCKSSTLPTDTTVSMYDLFFPVLFPGDPLEVLELGLHGIAMSRYIGLWTALKIVTNVADGGAVVDLLPDMAPVVIPELEIDGKPFRKQLDARLLPPFSLEMERQIHYERLVAAKAYARANHLDRIMVSGKADKLGLIASGKTYIDLVQALDTLGLDEEALKQAGIRLYKLRMITPLEPEGLKEFAHGLHEIVVVEEKRGFIETQVKELLYNETNAPRVFGKFDEKGKILFPKHDELAADQIAELLAEYLAQRLNRAELTDRVSWMREVRGRSYETTMARKPYFCSGCPHNTSTALPEGESHAGGGIGCHAMAAYMDRGVSYLTHMGGEGAPWLGLAPFTDKAHIFQNVGDGTFYHSASKSLEACIAGGANMTFRILFNSAVAMTGGQAVVGASTPTSLARKLEAEGASRIVIVAEDAQRHGQKKISNIIRVEPKSNYNAVMRELQQVGGVSVIIFDQQCAAEKRRQRKRGILVTPPRRVMINQSVCEGCGDCGVKANCLSVVPVQTSHGRKTQIHQSSCNFDYTCMSGDCPAFMTVELGAGAEAVKQQGLKVQPPAHLPEPATKASANQPYKTMLVGIGGTGVVTVDSLLVTAAAMEGQYALHLDQTGLSQKGGAVVSNTIICEKPIHHANKIGIGEANLMLAFDLLAAVSPDNLNRCHPEHTVAVANTAQTSTADVVVDIKARFPERAALVERMNGYTRGAENAFLDSMAISEGLLGSHLHNNIFLLGVAYQKGLLPLKAESLEHTIELNGVSVEQNIVAFRWGRQYVLEPDSVIKLLRQGETITQESPETPEMALARLKRFAPGKVTVFERLSKDLPAEGPLAELLPGRVADLLLYQNEKTARRYLDFVSRVAEVEQQRVPGRTELREAVARWLFKLMAVKDEYEVARLWLQDDAWEKARASFTGPIKRYVHLHPPFMRRFGLQKKLRFGRGVMPLFRLLYALRGLRGGPLDPFNRTAHRRMERGLGDWYGDMVSTLLDSLNHDNHAMACTLAEAPDGIRGYEEIKERTVAETRARVDELLEAYIKGEPAQAAGD